METEDLKLNAQQKREREYHDFIRLCRHHDDILNPALSSEGSAIDAASADPERAARIEALYQMVYASPYLRQLDRSALKGSFKDLETLLAATPGIPVSLNELGRKTREVQFLSQFAHVVKWQDYQRIPPDPTALREARKKIAAKCLELEELLLNQLEDESFLRKLHNNDLTNLPELIKGLAHFGEVFTTIKPELPYDRNRDAGNSVVRLVVDDLAQCCYRVYHACTYDVVRKLLKTCWLHAYARTRKGELEAMITCALERKQTAYLERTAMREDDRAPPVITRMPVRSL